VIESASATRGPEPRRDGGDDASSEAFSIGTYLRQQRALRNISLEDLSLRTRIPLRSLQRLEAGAFDGNADGFVRGFVRTVADGLGLDPDATLLRMMREPLPSGGFAGGFGLGPRAVVLGLAVIGALAFGFVAVRALSQLAAGASASAETGAVLRRDPVRELAEAQAAALAARPANPSPDRIEPR